MKSPSWSGKNVDGIIQYFPRGRRTLTLLSLPSESNKSLQYLRKSVMNKIGDLFTKSTLTLPCWCFRQTFMTTIISFVRKVRSVQLFCSRIDTIYLEPDLNMYFIKHYCHLPNIHYHIKSKFIF